MELPFDPTPPGRRRRLERPSILQMIQNAFDFGTHLGNPLPIPATSCETDADPDAQAHDDSNAHGEQWRNHERRHEADTQAA